MSAQVSELLLAGADEAADLGGYLSRLLRFDKAAAVRVVASGPTVGVYGRPPFDVLTLRTVALGAGESKVPVAGDADTDTDADTEAPRRRNRI